jgi:hypothetical protein
MDRAFGARSGGPATQVHTRTVDRGPIGHRPSTRDALPQLVHLGSMPLPLPACTQKEKMRSGNIARRIRRHGDAV